MRIRRVTSFRRVPLVIRGNVEQLVVDRSIIGPIVVEGTASVAKIVIRDSIVDGQGATGAAISLPAGRLVLRRVTVLGEVDAEELDASEALLTGYAETTNTQKGCFRFSAVLSRRDPPNPASPHSRVPHPFESQWLEDTAALFSSTRFGNPAYAQLSEAAPETVRRGAENGSEIGAFSSLLNPIKLDGLRAKVSRFAPFGTLPFFLFET